MLIRWRLFVHRDRFNILEQTLLIGLDYEKVVPPFEIIVSQSRRWVN